MIASSIRGPHVRLALVALALLGMSVSRVAARQQPASQPSAAKPVDFRKLKELLPEEALRIRRSSHDGENVSVGQWSMSTASADYTRPDSDGSDPHAAITIVDYGAAPEMVAGMTAWRSMPINIENDEGYQRTATFKDFPAFETYTKDGESRQMIVLVAERFLVNVEAAHCSEVDFTKLIEELPLDKLAQLK